MFSVSGHHRASAKFDFVVAVTDANRVVIVTEFGIEDILYIAFPRTHRHQHLKEKLGIYMYCTICSWIFMVDFVSIVIV